MEWLDRKPDGCKINDLGQTAAGQLVAISKPLRGVWLGALE